MASLICRAESNYSRVSQRQAAVAAGDCPDVQGLYSAGQHVEEWTDRKKTETNRWEKNNRDLLSNDFTVRQSAFQEADAVVRQLRVNHVD